MLIENKEREFQQGKDLDLFISLSENGNPKELPRGKSDEVTVLMCLNGSATFEHRHKEYSMEQHDILVIKPGNYFYFGTPDKEFSVSRIRFSKTMFDDITYNFPSSFFERLEQNPCMSIYKEDTLSRVEMCIKSIYNVISDANNICRYEIVINLLKVLLLEVYNITAGQFRIDYSQAKHCRRLLESFINYLEHYPGKREVAFFANLLSITPKYLSMIIHRTSGMTAKEFIDRKAVSHIKHLLRSTDLSVKEIADILEFPTTNNLCRFFKTRTGITISYFRQIVK